MDKEDYWAQFDRAEEDCKVPDTDILASPINFLEDNIIEYAAYEYYNIMYHSTSFEEAVDSLENYVNERLLQDFITALTNQFDSLNENEKTAFISRLQLEFSIFKPEQRKGILSSKFSSQLYQVLREKGRLNSYFFANLMDDDIFNLYNLSFNIYKAATFNFVDSFLKIKSSLNSTASPDTGTDPLVFKNFLKLIESQKDAVQSPIQWYFDCDQEILNCKYTINNQLLSLGNSSKNQYLKLQREYIRDTIKHFEIDKDASMKSWCNAFNTSEKVLFKKESESNELRVILTISNDNVKSIESIFSGIILPLNTAAIHNDFYNYFSKIFIDKAFDFLNNSIRPEINITDFTTFESRLYNSEPQRFIKLFKAISEICIIETDSKKFEKVFSGQDIISSDFPLIRWKSVGDAHTFLKWILEHKEYFKNVKSKNFWVRAENLFSDIKGNRYASRQLCKSYNRKIADQINEVMSILIP